MLGVKTYPPEYIESCRQRVDADIASYHDAVSASGNRAPDAFEGRFFNNMVVLLDAYFVHRLRTVEGKDGNPMNEVRLLTNSMLSNGNVLTPEKSIKYVPAKSVLKIEIDDEITLTEADFLALSKAYFAEIEAKFS